MTKDKLVIENESLKLEIKSLKEQLESFRRLVFSAKSERFIPVDEKQLDLFNPDAHAESPQEETSHIVIEKYSREVKKKSKHKGRSLLTTLGHLPCNEVVIEVEHEENDICIGQVERCSLG